MTQFQNQPPAQQPGQPPQQPGQPFQQQPQQPQQPQPKKPGKRRQKIVLAVLLVFLVVFFAAVWFLTRDNGENAQVGNCVTESGSNYVKIVGCGDPSATLKVVGRVEDKTETEARLSACDPFPSADQVFWEGKQGSTGIVLCLAKNGK